MKLILDILVSTTAIFIPVLLFTVILYMCSAPMWIVKSVFSLGTLGFLIVTAISIIMKGGTSMK